ncbi:hypothetical protein ACSMXN_12645 [Jatrophihabitans sp. DSM 45814]
MNDTTGEAARTTSSTDSPVRLWNRVLQIVALVVVSLCIVNVVAATTVRSTVANDSFYIATADRTNTFERIYDEVLVDPQLSRLTADLLAGQPAALTAAIGVNVRLVLPPDTLRELVAEQLRRFLRWLNGDTPTLELDVSLDPVLANLQGAAESYLSEVLAATPELKTVTVQDFEQRFRQVVNDLRNGRRPSVLPTVPLDARSKQAVETVLLSQVPGNDRASVQPAVHAALVTGDLDGAIAAVGGEIVTAVARIAQSDLLQIARTRTWSLTPYVEQVAGPNGMGALEKVRWWLGTPLELLLSGSIVLGLIALGGLIFLTRKNPWRQAIAIGAALGLGTVLACIVGGALWFWLRGFAGSARQPSWPGSIQQLVVDNAHAARTEAMRTWFSSSAVPALAAVAVLLAYWAVALHKQQRHRLGQPATPSERRIPAWLTGRGGPVTVAFGAACLLVIAGFLAPARPHVDQRCNGQTYLCQRPYDQVTSLATHNGMANTEDRFLFPLQDPDITTQLDAGARALQIDSWTWETPQQVASRLAGSGLPPDTVSALSAVAGVANPPRPGTWLCHVVCRGGALPIVPTLAQLRGWLDRNPREVVTIVLQDETPAALTIAAFEEAGLLPYIATPPANPASRWPTLGAMISSGHRLVVFTERAQNAAPWLQNFYAYGEETPFSFSSASALAEDSSCDENRGGSGKRLFLLNHFVTIASGSRSASAEVNATGFLEARVERCAKLRGQLPTMVAVDFASLGQAQAVVDDLNRSRR